MASNEEENIPKKDFFILSPDYQKADIIHFKEEILKELKEQNKIMIDQFKKEKDFIHVTLEEFTNKTSAFQIKINELSDLIVKDRVNVDSLKDIINFRKKVNDMLISNNVKLQKIEKEAFDNLTEINKILHETVIYPGLIGKKCKFECFHQLIDYILLQINLSKIFKEKLEFDFSIYNQKVDKNIQAIKVKIEEAQRSMAQFFLTNITECESRLNEKIAISNRELYELQGNYKYFVQHEKMEKESYDEKFNKLIKEIDIMKKDISEQKNFITDNKKNIEILNEKINRLCNENKIFSESINEKVGKLDNRITYTSWKKNDNNMNINFYTSEFENKKSADSFYQKNNLQSLEFSNLSSSINNPNEKNNQNFSYDDNLKNDDKLKLVLNNSNSEKNIMNNNNLPTSAKNKKKQKESFIKLYINGEIKSDEIELLAKRQKIQKNSSNNNNNNINNKNINNNANTLNIQNQCHQQNLMISRNNLKSLEANSAKSKHSSYNKNNKDIEDGKLYKKNMLRNNININVESIKKLLGIDLQDINAQFNGENINSPKCMNFGNYFVNYENVKNTIKKKNNEDNNQCLKFFSDLTTTNDNDSLNRNNYFTSLSEDFENREHFAKDQKEDSISTVTHKNTNNIISNKNKILQLNKNMMQNLLKSDKKNNLLKLSKSNKKLSSTNFDLGNNLIDSSLTNKNIETLNLNEKRSEIRNKVINISGVKNSESIKKGEKEYNNMIKSEIKEKNNKNNKNNDK